MKRKYTLSELLAGYTPANVPDEVDFGADVGLERAPEAECHRQALLVAEADSQDAQLAPFLETAVADLDDLLNSTERNQEQQPFMDGPFLIAALAGLIRENKLDLTDAHVEHIAEVFNRLQIDLHRHFSKPGQAGGQLTDNFTPAKPFV